MGESECVCEKERKRETVCACVCLFGDLPMMTLTSVILASGLAARTESRLALLNRM
jgi:hypothetical protein